MGWRRALFGRRRQEEGLSTELRNHVEMLAEEYEAKGMKPEEARRAAEQRLGGVASVAERCREENGAARVEGVWQDLRFAARTFGSQPGFTAVALATLALGIGANTAVFSVLRAVLLEPLPLRDPEQVVLVVENDRLRGTSRENASFPDYLDMREGAAEFEHLAASQRMDVTLTGQGEPERLPAARVTANYFDVLGLNPEIGRFFGRGEDGVVLSHGLWQRKFEGSPGVLGKVISLDGFHGTVLGVMPAKASALAPRGAELWSSLERVTATQHRGQHSTRVLGRLRKGASVEQAQARVSGIMTRLEKEYPDDNLGRGATVIPLHEELAGSMRPALKALSLAVVVLLLIACVNIANLLLARASARGREMAIRVSLGAARARLVRQLLTESLLLALAGGTLGIMVAWWGVKGLLALAPPDIALIGRTSIDGAALAATLGIALGAWLLFGLAPALRASDSPASDGLQGSGRNTASRSTLRLRHGLIVAQIGMAAVLVIFSGLLIRSFWKLRQIPAGYEPESALTFRVKLPESRYPWPKFPFREWPAAMAFCDRLKDSVSRVSGVAAVSVAMAGPAQESWTTRVTVVGRPVPPEGEQKEAQLRTADPDYLKATGASLRRGRFFEASDDERHSMVAVVNEAFVREHFPGEDPLGRRINVFGIPREVVGIIGDMRYAGPGTPPSPAMYFPLRQVPFPDLTVIVRSQGDPAALFGGLRQAVFAADSNVAPFEMETLVEATKNATARERFILSLLTVFASLALALSAIGIYGVVAYSAAGRRQEIALRIAVGARTRDVLRQLMGRTLIHAIAGVAGGAALAAISASLMQPLVFETSTRDGMTYAAVAAFLLAVALAGAAGPAWRAAQLDPASTLRRE